MKLSQLDKNSVKRLYMRRKNKTSRGMTFTSDNQKEEIKTELLPLLVKGTFDTLNGNAFRITLKECGNCPCCGNSIKKYALNTAGKSALISARNRARRRKWIKK